MLHKDEVALLIAVDVVSVQEDPTCLGSVSPYTLWYRGIHMTWDIQNILSHEFVSIGLLRMSKVDDCTIVPKVINPMRAVGGSKLKLTIKVSFKACKSDSSRQVSMTYRNIGGVLADLLRIYSIVVN